jgi:PAS domain S-box-containing protein
MVGDILLNALRREQMENELRQSEARNSALLSAVPDLILRIRRDGIFLDYKASANGLLAISPDQIVGSSIGNILDETHTKNAMQCIVNALENKQIQTMEYTIKNDNSSRVFEARFKDSGKDEVTAIIRDISERARLEQMKSDFINRASHELRTPIATMLLMANLIDGGTTQEEYREYWDVMKSELDRERLLVEDLLSVGRLENNQVDLHFSSFNIGEFIDLIIHQVELPAREKSISILRKTDLDLDEATCLIHGDKKALTQVFLNILNNAIKFTPANGKITIVLKKKDFGFEISIIDTGMGIPAEDIPLLFTRFFRGANAIEEEVPGTGIGLFIVRSILEKHGGNIKVWSELGKGSQFDIWLPGD